MRAGWWLVAWTVAAGALGCTDLAPTNPYDPQAPEAQQAKGTLDGTLTLPDGVTGAAFEGATVALFALSAPTTALREAAVVGEAGDDRRARFQFDDLPAGQYRVQPRVPGFALVLDGERTAGLVVQITIGGNASLGELILEADEADRFEVSGRVRLGGTEDGTHAGTRVEAVGSPDVVFTDDDGGWLLRLPAGRRTLRITRARYASVDLAVDVVEGRGAQVDDQVLVGDPAQVFGVLALANTTAGNLLTEAVITAEADGATAAQTNPSLDGSFALSGLAAGAYTIHLRRGGYVPVAIPVVLSVGELRDLTRTELAVDVQAVGATVVRGRAERAGADEDGHGGILVEVAGTPFATTTTSAGAFELGVAPGPVTLRFTAQGYNAEERSLPNVAEGAQVDLAQEVGVVRLSGEPGRLRGVLGLAGVQNPETVRAARVELRQDGEVLDQTNPEGDGAFLFAAVPAGRYELRLIAEGYDTLAFPVTVELGRTTELPLLVLAVSEAGETRVSGRVERLGGAPGSHGGIQVEVVGTDYATQTTSEGRFIVQVPPGAVQLRLSDRGYSPQEVQIPRVAAGTTWDHEAEVGVVRLVGEPASVQGLVTLSRLSTPERVQRATVTATPLAGGAPVGTNPDAEGRFGLVGLAAGDWILRVDGVGYDPIERPLRLEVGAGLDVGQVVLAHGAEGPNAGLFAGRVQVADGRDHAGTVVRLAVAGDDLPFATVLTDVEGRFEVRASREERYTLTLERDGYAIPEAAALGSFAWDDDIDLFLDPDGAGLDLVLDAQPVAGRVEVTVAVEPPWIPVAQRTATVEVRGVDAAADDDTRVVGTGETASLAVAATGRYLVTVSRAGFTSASQFVEITRDAPVTRLALGIELNNLAAAGLDFDGVPLEACALRGPYDLRQADFTGAVLSGEFGPVPADACGGCGMYCRALNLAGADLTGADLGGADLSSDDPADRVRLDEADLFGAALSGVDLSRALMRSADLFGADLSGALLDGAVLVGANLASADLQAARFTTLGPDEVPLVPCGQGGVRPDTRLELVNWNQADLRGAVMVGVDLGGASLEGARMAHTDLRGACLESARMVLNDLTQADLRGADAREASLTSAILSETDFRGADLTGADLVNAVIERARFDEPVGCQALDWDAHAQACLVGDPALP
ncbi:MAG: carboxypeptidase regulatory-like domain-containing protein, partial [Myxococcales bacterium]|nr:carboxypeptidase regulatory-like domain-containing protein [Myxococcales bacterium]